MAESPRRSLRAVALAVGLLAMLLYGAVQVTEPHGAFEFAYAPFTPEPLPYSAMRGFTYEQLWGHVRRIALFGPGLLLFVWGLAPYVRLRAPRDFSRLTRLGSLACVALVGVVMLLILRGRVVTDDELAYQMQAGFFAHGHVAGPELGVSPGDYFTIPTLVGYSIKYLPGEPLLQIPGVMLGIPALSHLVVVLVTLWAWQRALSISSGAEVARLSTLALACSPMLIFTSATGLSHASCLMWVVLMGLGVELGRTETPVRGALLAGVAFGFGLITRPQSMVPIGAVLGLHLFVRLLRRRAFVAATALVLTCGATVAGLLAYDHLLSGSVWKLPWFLQCGAEHYGFGRVWTTNLFEHGWRTALENLGVVALRLNSWLFGWPWSLAVVPAWLALGRRTAGAGVWLWVGLAVIAFEFFYYSPGASDTGAIYHYELLLPFSLLAGVVAQALLARFPEWSPLALVAALGLGTGSWVVEQALRMERLVTYIHRDSDRALALVDKSAPAVLIYERLENELVHHGWVFEAFPKRYRGLDAKVVTLPRVRSDMVARAARVYPGRSCYYFHYRPATDIAETLPCEQASRWLERPALDLDADGVAAFFEKPTAYLKTDYSPAPYIAKNRAKDAHGNPVLLCCQVRGVIALGVAPAEADKLAGAKTCVESGEP